MVSVRAPNVVNFFIVPEVFRAQICVLSQASLLVVISFEQRIGPRPPAARRPADRVKTLIEEPELIPLASHARRARLSPSRRAGVCDMLTSTGIQLSKVLGSGHPQSPVSTPRYPTLMCGAEVKGDSMYYLSRCGVDLLNGAL